MGKPKLPNPCPAKKLLPNSTTRPVKNEGIACIAIITASENLINNELIILFFISKINLFKCLIAKQIQITCLHLQRNFSFKFFRFLFFLIEDFFKFLHILTHFCIQNFCIMLCCLNAFMAKHFAYAFNRNTI